MANDLQEYRNERLASAGRHLRRARIHRQEAKRMGRRGCFAAARDEIARHERSLQDWQGEIAEVLWADREIVRRDARPMIFD